MNLYSNPTLYSSLEATPSYNSLSSPAPVPLLVPSAYCQSLSSFLEAGASVLWFDYKTVYLPTAVFVLFLRSVNSQALIMYSTLNFHMNSKNENSRSFWNCKNRKKRLGCQTCSEFLKSSKTKFLIWLLDWRTAATTQHLALTYHCLHWHIWETGFLRKGLEEEAFPCCAGEHQSRWIFNIEVCLDHTAR